MWRSCLIVKSYEVLLSKGEIMDWLYNMLVQIGVWVLCTFSINSKEHVKWRKKILNGPECCMIGEKLRARDNARCLRSDARRAQSRMYEKSDEDVKKEVTMTKESSVWSSCDMQSQLSVAGAYKRARKMAHMKICHSLSMIKSCLVKSQISGLPSKDKGANWCQCPLSPLVFLSSLQSPLLS